LDDIIEGIRESRILVNKKSPSSLKGLIFMVPPSELNVNQILEDTMALAQIWDLYGHLLSEN
jgi:hypothetical protein